MKTSNYKILSLIAILPSVLFITSCSKNNNGNDGDGCPPVVDVYCNIRTDEINRIPYHLHDTIKLQKNGDSTVYYFFQQSIDSGYSIYQNISYRCPGNKEYRQGINYRYVSSSYIYPLIISIYKYACDGANVSISIDQKNSFYQDCASIGFPYNFTNININGKTYNKVEKFNLYFPDTTQWTLYDFDFGVVQINSNGKIWYRYPQ